MNIYKVEQNMNNKYDSYDSFVCLAETEQEARDTHPNPLVRYHRNNVWYESEGKGSERKHNDDDWINPKLLGQIRVTLIGVALADKQKGVVVASFNAG